MTLTEFLMARIAEDEESAREPRWLALEYGVDSVGRNAFSARVLAECEAKRRIVENFEAAASVGSNDAECMAAAYQRACELIAAVYADHPDYDESWRP